MDERQCHRCGKLYGKYRNELDGIVEPNGIFCAKLYDDDSYYPSKWFNLCPECMEALKKWIGEEGRGMPEREREINTILTMVRTILLEAKLTITTKEEVPLLVKDKTTGELYAFIKKEQQS